MTFTQILVQIVSTFVAAALGAIFGAFLTRWIERYKQLRSLRADAYADFLRGISKAAVVQKEPVRERDSFALEREAMITVADAKARIPIYGSKAIVLRLSTFLDGGAVPIQANGSIPLLRSVN
jgi:hypothetical protein